MPDDLTLNDGPDCYDDGPILLPRQPYIPADNAEITNFLGKNKIEEIPVVAKPYYDEFLAWLTGNYIQEEKWEVIRIINQQTNPEPPYRNMSIGPSKETKILANGCLFLQRDGTRLVVQIWLWRRAMLIISHDAVNKDAAEKFAADIERLIEERNPYRKSKIHFNLSISFLEVKKKTWDDLILEEALKNEIRVNTVEFLKNSKLLSKYGIPAKRGLIISGLPGTGKTLINRIIMSTSPNITCIEAESAQLGTPEYIESLYDLAENLKPTIIFLEDIDIAGKDRFAESNGRDAGLLALLSALDGIEDTDGIVTVATTNCLQILDKALKERPSRFDLIIDLYLPEKEERRHLLKNLGKKIPIDAATLEYVAEKTCGFTPAQLQEVLYSLVIRKQSKHGSKKLELPLRFQAEEINSAIVRVARGKSKDIGFRMSRN